MTHKSNVKMFFIEIMNFCLSIWAMSKTQQHPSDLLSPNKERYLNSNKQARYLFLFDDTKDLEATPFIRAPSLNV